MLLFTTIHDRDRFCGLLQLHVSLLAAIVGQFGQVRQWCLWRICSLYREHTPSTVKEVGSNLFICISDCVRTDIGYGTGIYYYKKLCHDINEQPKKGILFTEAIQLAVKIFFLLQKAFIFAEE